MFRSDRLKNIRIRVSAAYNGVYSLLIKEGAQDFRSGQKFDHTVFFGENVDIHHIFPKEWCKNEKIRPDVYDSIINKTPLSYKTNRIIGGLAPSDYLEILQKGNDETPCIAPDRLDIYLASHLINPLLLRANRFYDFMADRQKRLLSLIEQATGRTAYFGEIVDDEDVEEDEDAFEAERTISAE